MASSTQRKIHIIGGRVYSHEIVCTDADGDPIVFDSADTFKAQVRAVAQSDDVLAEFTIDDSDKDTGIVRLSLDEDESEAIGRNGVWDVVWYVGGDDPYPLIPESPVVWSLGVTR